MNDVTLTSATLTWDFVKRVKDVTKMRVLIKGLESADDTTLAVTSGADGIIVWPRHRDGPSHHRRAAGSGAGCGWSCTSAARRRRAARGTDVY
jgi:isopentenyl diphosphate isomerase/L-lactate dehydrogenase-like FMN-dependent dehydrogenase